MSDAMFGEREDKIESRDTEITLGTARLLGIFFGLVAICGICLGIGYQLGRNAAKNGAPPIIDGLLANAGIHSPKPDGGTAAATPAASPEASPEASPSPDLSFYKAVEQNAPSTSLEKAEPAPMVASEQPAPEMTKSSSNGGYLVQIAAVTNQEDAQALADALKKKNYAVFIASTANDKYFRVQIGPFGEIGEAESMRRKLISDGYNPIVKK